MRRIAAAVLFVFSLVCSLARPALAQEGSATLTGFVEDSSKAVIPGVKVTALATNTNQRFGATTGKDGNYTIVALPVGPYQIQIEKPGFKTILKDDLFLHTQDALEINFQMAVGSTSETVTVNGITTNDSPAVSMTVTHEFVENMPLNGRSFQDLIQLAPGTVSSNGYYSIDGQRTDSNNYTVDGVSANLGGVNNHSTDSNGSGLSGVAPAQTALGTTQSLASVDSLQEFTIQTSGYTAEYGRNPGGQVQLTTRSGTNGLHGSLFDYLRNTVFDANSWYNDYFSDPQTAEHQNDFGGTIGGPLTVPRLYNGKDKTFYFVSYEGLRLLLPTFESKYVPTQAFRNWASPNVQPFLNAAPPPSPVSLNNPTAFCTAPDPQTTGQPDNCLFNYGYSYPNNLDTVSVRLDNNLGKRFHAFVRYADTPSYVFGANSAENPARVATDVHTWTAGLTTTMTSHLLDELRFNYSHDAEQQVYSLASVGGSIPWNRNLLIPAAYDGPYAYGEPYIKVSSISLKLPYNYSASGSTQHQYQIVDSLAWTRGPHSIKVGVDWRRLAPTAVSDLYNSYLVIQSLAAIQQGYATTLQIGAEEPGQPRVDNLSLYIQDHWKISTRLSFDYGLRWEFNPPPGPSNGFYPVTLTSSNLAVAQLTNDAGSQPYKTVHHDFAPRIGFAWTAIPLQKHPVTVRGGFGIFFDTGQSLAAAAYFQIYPFTAFGPTLSNVPLPLSSTVLAPPSLHSPLTPPYPTMILSDPDLVLPYTEQWNLSVDEQLNANNTLTASYVGNNGRKLLFTAYYNGIAGNTAFSSFDYTNNGSQSSYNALQIQDRGRITHGLDIVGSFMWAHALDNASSDYSGYTPIYGNSNFDLRRSLNLALNYSVPSSDSMRWLHTLTQGWLFANRFSAQSGVPLAIIQDTVYETDGNDVQYSPNLVPGVPIYLHGTAANLNGQRVPDNWRLNSAAFALVPTNPTTGNPIQQGTLGRNYVRNPPLWALNTAVQRSFRIYERLQLNFRADAFNILNHPNFAVANTSLTSPTFGEVIGGETTYSTIGSSNPLYAMGAARSLQFSLKLQF